MCPRSSAPPNPAGPWRSGLAGFSPPPPDAPHPRSCASMSGPTIVGERLGATGPPPQRLRRSSTAARIRQAGKTTRHRAWRACRGRLQDVARFGEGAGVQERRGTTAEEVPTWIGRLRTRIGVGRFLPPLLLVELDQLHEAAEVRRVELSAPSSVVMASSMPGPSCAEASGIPLRCIAAAPRRSAVGTRRPCHIGRPWLPSPASATG